MGKLKPYDKNARLHPPEQIDKIKRLIEKVGFVVPILVDGKNGILKGHGSLQAAMQLGMRSVPVIELDGLSPAMKRAYIIGDNRAALDAGWDDTLLAAELGDLKAMGLDLTLTGFELGEIKDFLEPTPGPQEPPTPALPAHATSRLGDIWLLGEHRIICGDATKTATMKALMGGREAQCVFTDPPYGVSYQEGPATTKHPKRYGVMEGDAKRRGELVSLLTQAFSVALRHTAVDAPWYVWHASATRDDFAAAALAVGLVEPPNGYIIWVKPATMGWSHYKSAFEPCFYFHRQGTAPEWQGDRTETTVWRAAAITKDGHQFTTLADGIILASEGGELFVAKAPKGKKVRHLNVGKEPVLLQGDQGQAANVWEIGRSMEGEARHHPTQKPVELARRALRNSTSEGEGVLDMFLGSASTIIAAEQTRRVGFGVELDPRYVDVGVRRWQELTGKQAIHATEKKTFDAIAKSRSSRRTGERERVKA